ncbi:MAG TPA: hypothetical protein VMG80_03880 [Solirubrobacteraceae bacterium]|nr:hypothetical protein [Solirubrobacteraceae bacterium]
MTCTLACTAVGATPSAAFAVTFGADLSQPANNPITCGDGVINQILGRLEYPLTIPPGSYGSCLWTGSGVTQSLEPPESGTVTAVKVRVGPVTGAMRVVVLRALYKNSFVIGEPEVACCVIQQYGPEFRPAVNSVSTIETGLNMDVQPAPPEGDFEVVHFDLLGLEALEPNVPIPAYSATEGGEEPGTPDFAWYPAPSLAGVPAPSPDVDQYQWDFSGFQVLMSAEMAGPAPGGGGGTGGRAGPQPAAPAPVIPVAVPVPRPAIPGLTLPRLTLPVQNGGIALPVQCTGADCIGAVLLQNIEQPGATIARAGKHSPKTVTYGSSKVNVKAGAKGKVTVRLNGAGRRASRHRSLKVWANFTFGSIKLSERITLRG